MRARPCIARTRVDRGCVLQVPRMPQQPAASEGVALPARLHHQALW